MKSEPKTSPDESRAGAFQQVAECLYRHRSSGTYYGLVKRLGKQYRRSLKTDDRKLAERFLAEFKRKVDRLDHTKARSSVTFAECAKLWLATVVPHLKASSARRRETSVAQILPYLGSVTVRNLTSNTCEVWAAKRGPGIAASTYNNERDTIIAVLNYAKREGLLLDNPALVLPRRKLGRTSIVIPSKAQFEKLVATLRGLDVRYRDGADLVELLAYSGMRLAEATSLRWKDVDFENGRFTVTGGAVNMIMAGAAAGLAAAFNTPLGGIVFAVEELTKTHMNYFKTALFSAVIIAGLTAQGFLGPYLYFGYPDVSNLSSFMFVPVIGIAVLTGFMGSIMSKLMLIVLRWKKTFKSIYEHIIFLVVSALILTLLAIFINVNTFGSGKDFITHILFTNQKYTSWDVSLMRIVGPLLSFTSGAAGGIFAPSLSAGAGLGSMVAGWFHLSATNANLLVLSGMVGFLTGVTRTPFTSAILVLEMTDRHNLIFFLILAGMIASMAAYIIDKHSLYDHLRGEYVRSLTLGPKISDEKIIKPSEPSVLI